MAYNPDSFEASISRPPVVSPEIHILISECAEGLAEGETTHGDGKSVLEQVCVELSVLDPDMMSYLGSLQDRGVLSRDEALYLTSYFLARAQSHPHDRELRDMMYSGQSAAEEFSHKVLQSGLSEAVANLMISAYVKAQ